MSNGGDASSGGQQSASGGLAGSGAGGTPNPAMSEHGGNLRQGPDSDYPRTYALIVSEMPNGLHGRQVSGMGKSEVEVSCSE